MQYYCTTFAQYTPAPTDPPFECHALYNIGDGNIVYRPSSDTTAAAAAAVAERLYIDRSITVHT